MSADARRHLSLAVLFGLACHGLFAAGVSAMIAMMFFGMSRSFGPFGPPWSYLANGLLLTQFPLAHSWLLTDRGRALLGSVAPGQLGAHLSTTTYAMIASGQILILFTLWSPSGTIWWRSQGAASIVLCGLYTTAWLLLLRAIVDAGFALQVGLLGWWAVARDVAPVYPRMPRSGLFRICRQPIYVAFALTLWTVPTWTPDQLALSLTLTAYCLIGPLFKEARFLARFGEEFEAYKRSIPYWLPWPSPIRSADSIEKAAHPGDLSIYEAHAGVWWKDSVRWLRTLRKMVPARFEYFDPLVGDWRGKNVLDLGCGGGFMSEALARRGAITTAIDPCEAVIARARIHAEHSGLSIAYCVGVGEQLPLGARTVDIVVCVDVLEHVVDLRRVLTEVRRVLKPGGLFLFDTINRTWAASLVIVILGESVLRYLPVGTHDPRQFIPPRALIRELKQVGFVIGSIAGFGPRGIDRAFDLSFGRLPTKAIMYVGLARAPE